MHTKNKRNLKKFWGFRSYRVQQINQLEHEIEVSKLQLPKCLYIVSIVNRLAGKLKVWLVVGEVESLQR